MMLLTIIVFILILSLLVLIHEFGHYLLARKNGIRVEEFGFGLPPRVWGKKIGETIYSLNLLPIGGFVKLTGEDPVELDKSDKKNFSNKSLIQRTMVIIAGVLFNFLLAILIFTAIFTVGVPVPVKKVIIKEIVANSPAALVGLRAGDEILEFNDSKLADSSQLVEKTQKSLGQEVKLKVKEKSGVFEITLVPRKEYPNDQGPMGISLQVFETKSYPIWLAPLAGIEEAFRISGLMIGGLVAMLGQWIIAGQAPRDVAGPVGIAQITGQAVSVGPLAILQFLGILSLNLAIINILPLPALDGGRLVFLGIEAVFRRRVYPQVERWVHTAGMVLLILLILAITYNDILRILNTTSFGARLRELLP